MSVSWEDAVAWARETPEMADLVQACYYDDPIEASAERFKASEEWFAIRDLLRPAEGHRVLEIGAGRGMVIWAFAREGCEAYALEPNPSGLVGSGAIQKLCEITETPIHILDLTDGKISSCDQFFDIVVCRGVLHHVQNLDDVCLEVFRVLRPAGCFLVMKEHVADTPEELSAFLRVHPLHHLYGGENAYPLKSYKHSMRRAGFRIKRIFGHFDHPITSAPAFTTRDIQLQAAQRIFRLLPKGLRPDQITSPMLTQIYRHWMTYRSRIPGRLYSFLLERPR